MIQALISILGMYLPHSLWFDLGTSRNILLRSPALRSEQVVASILSPSIFTKPTLTFLPLNSFGKISNPFDILAWCWSPCVLIRFGFGLKVDTMKKREDERKRRKKMKGFALVEEEVLEPIDLIWFDLIELPKFWCGGVRESPTESVNFCIIWRMNNDFYLYLQTFSNTLSNKLFISFSISYKYYFFIHYLFFFNNYTSFNIFFIQHLIIIIEKKDLKNEQ